MSYMNPAYRPPNWFHPLFNSTVHEEFEWLSFKGITMIVTVCIYAALIGGSITALTYLAIRMWCCGGFDAPRNSRRQVADSAAPLIRPLVLGPVQSTVDEVRVPLAEPEIIVTPV